MNHPSQTADSRDKCLVVTDLSVDVKSKRVVDRVSVQVSPGEIVGLFGPNGAGKSTFINCISGIMTPDTGTVMLNGRDVTHDPLYLRARRGLGLLPQKPSIFLGLSVEQNILAALELKIKDRFRRMARLEALLAQFEIAHIKHTKGHSLSGGETRRVELARCLACEPRVIILDEPFAGLDPIILNKIKELVQSIITEDMGVLIVDHNIPETITMIDKGYVLVAGRIVVQGTPRQIVSDDFVRKNYLGENFAFPGEHAGTISPRRTR